MTDDDESNQTNSPPIPELQRSEPIHLERTELGQQEFESVGDVMRRGFREHPPTREAPGPGRVRDWRTKPMHLWTRADLAAVHAEGTVNLGSPADRIAADYERLGLGDPPTEWGDVVQPRTRPLVGIAGRKRAGKSTAAEALTALGYEAHGFADELKEAALQLDPWVDEDWPNSPVRLSEVVIRGDWETAKDVYPEVRRILQRLGTDVVRSRDPEFWLRALDRRIGDIDDPVVIPDVRFDNEAQWVKDRGGFIIEIIRPDHGDTDDHASEAGVSEGLIDYRLFNVGTVETLHDSVRLTLDCERAA